MKHPEGSEEVTMVFQWGRLTRVSYVLIHLVSIG